MKRLLQAEGAALFVAATIAYFSLDISWWMYAVLFFAPDVAFLAYLAGPKVGALAYNILHATIGPILLGIVGWFADPFIMQDIVWGAATVWLAHVGFDRMLGYGLKHTSGFKDTHLGKI